LGEPDAVILLGSKNVIGNLKDLQTSGMAAVARFLKRCGGT
jgi:cobyric acid synthase